MSKIQKKSTSDSSPFSIWRFFSREQKTYLPCNKDNSDKERLRVRNLIEVNSPDMYEQFLCKIVPGLNTKQIKPKSSKYSTHSNLYGIITRGMMGGSLSCCDIAPFIS